MHIDELMGAPALEIEIAGRAYRFGELTLGALAELQAFLRKTVPHPLDCVRGRLDGFRDDERSIVLREAAQAALKWPPSIGAPEGVEALLGTEAGQVEALRAGLKQYQPETTAADAERLYRALKRGGGDGAAARPGRRVYAVLFGLGDPGAGAETEHDAGEA